MKTKFYKFFFTLAAVASLMLTSEASRAAPITVLKGADYLASTDNTHFDFGEPIPGYPIGDVFFTGLPIGPGSTDTIVKRTENAVCPDGGGACSTIDIEIVALSLVSIDPVDLGGQFFDVFVDLDSSAPSTGFMDITINPDATGGTYESSFTVNYNALFTNTLDPLDVFSIPGSLLLSITDQVWSTTPSQRTTIVQGLVGDGMANLHLPKANTQRDFFPGIIDLPNGDKKYAEMCHANPAGGHEHCVETSMVPIPAAVWLFGSGLIGLIGIRKKSTKVSA